MTAGSPGVDVTVLSAGHDVADARLHREVAAMLQAGLVVEVLGLGDAAGGPPGAATRAWPRRGLAMRAVLAAALPLRARGTVLMSLDPDTALATAVTARLRRRRWVADVHEDYPALLRDRAWASGAVGRMAGRLARVATRVVASADLTVVADEHLPPGAHECRRRLVVRNMPDVELVRAAAGAVPRDSGRPRRAVYVGDVRRSRGLRAMLEAVAAAPGWELDVIGPVAGADAPWAQERCSRPDLDGRVRLHGRLTPQQSWAVAAGADAGVALLDDTPAFRAAVPTKVYEYLAAGFAVLSTPLPRVADLVRASGAGELVPDAEAAAAVLRRWSAEPESLAAARSAAAAWADEHLDVASPYAALAAEVTALAARPRR